jgi:hypothetical protein
MTLSARHGSARRPISETQKRADIADGERQDEGDGVKGCAIRGMSDAFVACGPDCLAIVAIFGYLDLFRLA